MVEELTDCQTPRKGLGKQIKEFKNLIKDNQPFFQHISMTINKDLYAFEINAYLLTDF